MLQPIPCRLVCVREWELFIHVTERYTLGPLSNIRCWVGLAVSIPKIPSLLKSEFGCKSYRGFSGRFSLCCFGGHFGDAGSAAGMFRRPPELSGLRRYNVQYCVPVSAGNFRRSPERIGADPGPAGLCAGTARTALFPLQRPHFLDPIKGASSPTVWASS